MTTNDDILKVAREVFDYPFKPDAQGQRLITFARRIAAMQREIDAGICTEDVIRRHLQFLDKRTWQECAAAIREQT